MDYAIEARDISKQYPSQKQRTAVSGLNLAIPKGQLYSLVGPDGAGKTTTIRLLLGLLAPTAGQAEVFGFDTRTQAGSIREQTGALLEHTGLYERLTAEDNLEFYGRVYRLSPAERLARGQKAMPFPPAAAEADAGARDGACEWR